MRRFLCTMLVILPALVDAQSVYKCRDAKGQAVYQSQPCEGGKPPEKAWAGEYRQPTNDELWARYNRDKRWQQRQQVERARRSANSYYVAPALGQSKSAKNALACSASRAEYARVQADFKLNRNINLLRRLEADIYRYCEARP